MGKVIWRGWITDPEQIAKADMVTPLGAFVKRDGCASSVSDLPAAKAKRQKSSAP